MKADAIADGGPAADKPAKPARSARSRSSSTTKPGRLKDMLGLAHLSAASGGPDESERFRAAMEEAKSELAETTAVAPAGPPASAKVESPPEELSLIVEVVSPASHPAFSIAVPFTLSQAPASMERLDISDLELTVVDEPIPALPLAVDPQDFEGAAEIARIAGEIASYGVPAAESERVRVTLLDLAHAIERGDPSWEALRAATSVVMHYPKLGRRAMPVLLPLLDRTG